MQPAWGYGAAATREGTLQIIHEDSLDKYGVVETVKTEFEAKTMALDPKTHNLYLTTSDFGPHRPPQRDSPIRSQSRPGNVSPSDFLIYGRRGGS